MHEPDVAAVGQKLHQGLFIRRVIRGRELLQPVLFLGADGIVYASSRPVLDFMSKVHQEVEISHCPFRYWTARMTKTLAKLPIELCAMLRFLHCAEGAVFLAVNRAVGAEFSVGGQRAKAFLELMTRLVV